MSLPDLRWALLAAAVTFVATLRVPRDPTRESWMSTSAAKLLLGYTVWLWIQQAWALDHAEQMDICILFTKYIVLYYLIYRLVDTPQKVTWFLVAHVLGCAYLGWLAYNARVSGRLEGVGGPGIDEANALAMQMGTGVAVAAMLMLGIRLDTLAVLRLDAITAQHDGARRQPRRLASLCSALGSRSGISSR